MVKNRPSSDTLRGDASGCGWSAGATVVVTVSDLIVLVGRRSGGDRSR
jgi:hypothetical protein